MLSRRGQPSTSTLDGVRVSAVGRNSTGPGLAAGPILLVPFAILLTSFLTAVASLLAVATVPRTVGAAPTLIDPAPAISGVTPGEADNRVHSTMSISGTNFGVSSTARLGHSVLSTAYVSSTVLSATVPPGLPGGVYSLTVTNPDGQSSSLENALTVNETGDGALGEWRVDEPLSFFRRSAGVASWDSRLYVVGGHTGHAPYSTNTVDSAAINEDGSIGPSRELTATLAVRRHGTRAVARGGFLYVSGGFGENGSPLASVERAAIRSDGTLGTWELQSSHVDARGNHALVTAGDYLYALGGGGSNSQVPQRVERARINLDGSLGAWELLPSLLTSGRSTHTAVAAGNYLYILGGTHAYGTVYQSIERALIRPDGTLGDWELTTPLSRPRHGHASVAFGQYIYVMGGANNSIGHVTQIYSSTERTRLLPDGSLGSWETLPSLTVPRYELGATTAQGRIVAVGGRNQYDSIPYRTVESTPLSPISLSSASPSSFPAGGPTFTLTVTGTNFVPTLSRVLWNGNPRPTTLISPTQALATIDSADIVSVATNLVMVDSGGAGQTSNPVPVISQGATPSLSSFTPHEANNAASETLSVSGTHFAPTPSVWLGNLLLPSVNLPNSTSLTATIPVGLAPGAYTVTVGNPDGQIASSPSILTLRSDHDGRLGAWQTTTPNNLALTGRAAFAHGDYLYAVGGFQHPQSSQIVERATILPGGQLGAWEVLSSTLSTGRASFGVVRTARYVYALGGYTGSYSVATNTTERAELLPDGSLGPWETAGSLTIPRRNFATVAANGYVYVIGGRYHEGESSHTPLVPYLKSVERAAILRDGSLGPWQATTPLNSPLAFASAFAASGYIYAHGGSQPYATSTALERAQILTNGDLGPWETTAHLPNSHGRTTLVTSGGYAYVVSGTGTAVQRSALHADGNLGPWQTSTSLPQERTEHAVVAEGGYLYVVGGTWGTGTGYYLDSVVWTAMNPPGIDSLSPQSAVAGSGNLTLTVDGGNFGNGTSTVHWNSTPRSTTFVSSTRLTAGLSASDLAAAGVVSVTVHDSSNLTPLSNAKSFTVTAPTTSTPSPTATPSSTPSPTATPTSTSTASVTATPTAVPSSTPTNVPTPSATAIPSSTQAATSTTSPIATATQSATPVPVTPTPSPVPGTTTATATTTPLPVQTATATSTPLIHGSATPTASTGTAIYRLFLPATLRSTFGW